MFNGTDKEDKDEKPGVSASEGVRDVLEGGLSKFNEEKAAIKM